MPNEKKISIATSLESTKELRQLIIDNPNLPLVIFAGEYAWTDRFLYELTEAHGVAIKSLCCYKDYYVEKSDYRDYIADDLSYEDKYKTMLDADFDKMVDDIVAKTEFTKCIVIYVG